MKIAEKSTEIGNSADIAQEYYDACEILEVKNSDGTFKCVTAKGLIVSTDDHNGRANFNIYYDSCEEGLNDGATIIEATTDEDVKTSIKAYINALEWSETPLPETSTAKTKA